MLDLHACISNTGLTGIATNAATVTAVAAQFQFCATVSFTVPIRCLMGVGFTTRANTILFALARSTLHLRIFTAATGIDACASTRNV
jgi:hypothetical protein